MAKGHTSIIRKAIGQPQALRETTLSSGSLDFFIHACVILLPFTGGGLVANVYDLLKGLTVHRALLLKTTSSESPKQTDTLQLILSQNAILDSAMDIAAYAKASLQLGMKPCFAFLATSLYIGYLALWEHLQIKQSPGRIDDTSKIEQGMNNIIWAVDYIHKTGDNSAMAEIVAAIRAMGRSPARNRLTSVEPPLHTPTVASDGVCFIFHPV